MKPAINSFRHSLLKYDIRALAVVAEKIGKLGGNIWAWENIGDPIKQGHQIPDWIKEKLKQQAEKNENWGYSPTEGLQTARKFVAQEKNKLGVALSAEDVVFGNGLGHCINTFYQILLGNGARVIHPSPTYPAHSSSESFFAGQAPLLYRCVPEDNWQPDFTDLENKIKTHPEIGFILIIAPNNPTGVCYSQKTLTALADLAIKYDLAIISDETYIRLTYTGQKQVSVAEILTQGKNFPLIIMGSASKDIPWPGGRSGWLEFYNPLNDPHFVELEEAFKQALRVQVCSTTMVQASLPEIYNDERYYNHLKNFVAKLEEQSNFICYELNKIIGLSCVPAQGAFYLAATFKQGVLRPKQTLPITNHTLKKYVEEITSDPNLPLDKQFAIYLMAARGIFVTPLSGFEGPMGFRVTTLKTNLEDTKKVYSTLKTAVEEYLNS